MRHYDKTNVHFMLGVDSSWVVTVKGQEVFNIPACNASTTRTYAKVPES